MAVNSDFEIESIPVSSLNDSDFTLDEEATKKNIARILAGGAQATGEATGATLGVLQSPAAGEASREGRFQNVRQRAIQEMPPSRLAALARFGPTQYQPSLPEIAQGIGKVTGAIMEPFSEMGAEFLRSSGLDPSAQAGKPVIEKVPFSTDLPLGLSSPLAIPGTIAEQILPEAVQSLKESVGKTLGSFTEPGAALTAPLLGIEGGVSKAAALLFGSEQLAQLPESVQHAVEVLKDPNSTNKEKIDAWVHPGVSAVVGGVMMKHGLEGRPAAPAEVPIPGEAMPVPTLPEGPRIEPAVKPETQPEKGAPDAVHEKAVEVLRTLQQPEVSQEGAGQMPAVEPSKEAGARGGDVQAKADQILLTQAHEGTPEAPSGNVRVRVQMPDGEIEPALWNGYYEAEGTTLNKAPSVAFVRDGKWSHGTLPEGAKILDPVPTFDEWKSQQTAPPVVRDVPAGSVAPEAIVPAIRLIGGEVVSGKAGETHPDIIKREGLKAEDIDQRGFSDPAGKQFFLDREAAAKGTQVATEREPGRLHSTDLQKEAGEKPPVEFSTFGPIQKAVEYLARKGSALAASVSPHLKSAWNFIKDFTKEAQAMPRTSDYRRSVLNWSAKLQRSFGEAADLQRHAESVVKDPVRREAITNWIEAGGDTQVLRQRAAATTDPRLKAGYEAAANLTPEELALAQQIKQKFDALATRGTAAGVLKSFRDNYVTHIWDLGKTKAIGGGSRTLREKFKFSKARTFDTFFAGEQAGFVPKTKDISKLIPAYLHEMNSVIAARELVAELSRGVASDGRPLVSPKGVGIPVSDPTTGQGATLVMPKVPKADMSDYRTLENQPALSDWRWAATDEAGNPVLLKADLALHPEAYSRIKAVLGKSAIREWYQSKTSYAAQIPKTLVAALDSSNKITKQTMLGAGSPFHQVQTGTHAVGHRVAPFNIPKIDLMNNAEQMDAARHGLMMNPDRASFDQFMEGFKTYGLVSKIPGIGPAADWYSNYLFHEYIPGLKFKTYQSILNRNLKVYAKDLASGKFTAEDVKILSGEQTNAAFGHLNYADLGRNPTIQHILQLGLLAPDFLEARARFAGQSIKGLTGAKVGREQLLALATLAVGQAALAYTGAALTEGEWDKNDPFTFHVGNKKFTIRSVPEDITSLIKNAHQFVHSRLSPIIGKGALQYLSGVDYRGRKVTPSQTTKELLQQPIPISVRGFLGIGNSPLSGWEQLWGAIGLKISRYSPGTELNTLVDKWRETAGPKQQADLARRQQEVFVSTYQPMKDALTRGDQSRAREEYDKLLATGKKPEDVMKAMRPYTLTKANELKAKSIPGLSAAETQKFLRSLSPEDRKLYDKAKAEQKAQFQRFLDMLKQTKKPLPAKEERIKFAA